MTRERYDFLFQQFQTGRITAEDWEELRAAIGQSSVDPGLAADLSELLRRDAVHADWDRALESDMWQVILDRRGQPLDRRLESGLNQKTRNRKRGKIHWMRYTAIAAAILVCVAMVWLFVPSSKHIAVLPAAGKVGHDLRPGGNRAILTLAD